MITMLFSALRWTGGSLARLKFDFTETITYNILWTFTGIIAAIFGIYTAKLTGKQVRDLLAEKKLIFSFNELKKQTVLPRSYAVVIDFDVAKNTVSGFQDADKLSENPIFVARTGTVEQATEYVKKTKIVHKTNKLGNWHQLNSIDPTQPQGRVPYFGNYYGCFDVLNSINDDGRPVGVAPEALVVYKKNGVSPKLEQILQRAKHFVPESSWGDFSKKMSELYK